ncbi:MAG: hypothetical protein OQK97_00880 [Deltaproteobacteria bacterium]|nr:hypothetical protein [Deltaproteobacteria bacterium]
MLKSLLLLISVFVLASCAPLFTQVKQAVPQDQLGFTRAFDAFQATNRIDQLQQFKKDYPDSDWATRAGTIILYALELDQRKSQVEKNTEVLAQQELDLSVLKKDNLQLSQEIESLSETNQQLTQQIEQLKGLLIQLEKRPQ